MKRMVLSCLFAALTAVGAFISIPVGPVPIVLQNFFVLLAGLVLGPRWGLASAGIYLLTGVLGFPVFSLGRGGIAHLAGPTGGYLVGYLPAVLLTGAVARTGKPSLLRDGAAAAVGAAAVYACGVPWLKFVLHLGWREAVLAGLLPFLIGDAVKVAAAAAAARLIRPLVELPAWFKD